MTPTDIDTFINSPEHVKQIALTKQGAIALRRAIRRLEQQAYERGVASVDPAVFELKDRDDGKYAPFMFARIASCLADERRLMGEGLVTAAGAREML